MVNRKGKGMVNKKGKGGRKQGWENRVGGKLGEDRGANGREEGREGRKGGSGTGWLRKGNIGIRGARYRDKNAKIKMKRRIPQTTPLKYTLQRILKLHP